MGDNISEADMEQCAIDSPMPNLRNQQNTSFADISPIPKPGPSHSGNKQSSPKQHSQILTDTPRKAVLEEKQRSFFWEINLIYIFSLIFLLYNFIY